MTTMEPIEGPCGGCQRTAMLTRYQVDHSHWYEPDSYSCRWCMRFPQPLLCPDCTTAERAEEAGRFVSQGERNVVDFLRCGAELDEQRRAS
jgi:hypothetical protein